MIIYLYVKQHASTGLKYFGKTIKKDPYSYKGSGKYWRRHLRQHGRCVNTLEVWGFDDPELCKEFALQYSKDNDIVASKQWANLIEENGLDGGPTLTGKSHSETTKSKISSATKGRVFSAETRDKMSKAWKSRSISEETKAKMKAAQLLRRERERSYRGSLAVLGR